MSPAANGSRAKLRRLAVLIAVNVVDMIGFMVVLPLLPFYAQELHASPEIIGALIASFSIAQLLAAPVWGRVSDRYGRRPALLIGLTASALAYVVFGLADSLWLLFLSRVVQGAGGGTTGVAQAYVADTMEPADRARALGWLSAATAVGVTLGPALGSLAAHWGHAAPGLQSPQGPHAAIDAAFAKRTVCDVDAQRVGVIDQRSDERRRQGVDARPRLVPSCGDFFPFVQRLPPC